MPLRKKDEKKEYPLWLKILLPVVFWLALWCIASLLINKELLLPTPLETLKRFFELAVTWDFWETALLSLLRIILGIIWGSLLGIFMAWLTFKANLADCIFSPVIRIIRATPVASFIILVLLWVNTGTVPTVISGLMVMPVMWQNVRAGIENTDPLLIEMTKVYGFGKWKAFRYLYVPSVYPYLISGLCTSIGFGWKSGVAAEIICLPKAAIGTQIYYSKIYLETPSLFAWTAVVIILSIALEQTIKRTIGKGGVK